MANTLGIDYEADHKELEADRGLTVTYGGVDYSAIVSLPRESREYESDGSGYYVARSLMVTIRMSLVSGISVGEKITYDGTQYRIAEIMQESDTGIYHLTCEGLS